MKHLFQTFSGIFGVVAILLGAIFFILCISPENDKTTHEMTIFFLGAFICTIVLSIICLVLVHHQITNSLNGFLVEESGLEKGSILSIIKIDTIDVGESEEKYPDSVLLLVKDDRNGDKTLLRVSTSTCFGLSKGDKVIIDAQWQIERLKVVP